MNRLSTTDPIALVELSPTQFGILDGIPAADVYSTVKMPPRALPTLKAVLSGLGLTNVRMFFTSFHGPVSKGSNWGMIRTSKILMISSIVRTTPQSFALSGRYKDANPEGIVIVGGPAPTFSPEAWLREGRADIVVIKEGEVTLAELMGRMMAGEDWRDIAGIAYLDGGGEVVITPPRKRMTSAEWSCLPDPLYDDIMIAKIGQSALEQLRGCPHRCDFCNVTQFYEGTIRCMKTEAIIRRIRQLRSIGLGDHWFLTGDNANVNEAAATRMFESIIAEGLIPKGGITMQVSSEIGKQPKLLDLAYRGGARTACVGFEAVSDDTLGELKKPFDSADNLVAVQALRENGLWVHGMFVVSPGGPRGQVSDILEWGQSNVDSLQIFPATPFEGTPFTAQMREEGRILTNQLNLYDAQHVVVQPEQGTAYERQVEINEAVRKFYSPKWTAARLKRSPIKSRTLALGAYTALGGLERGFRSPQMRAHLDFLKSLE